MSAGVGALAGDGPSWIGDASAVSKSFPGFWTMLATLREEGSA
jgi:5-enolpyruvylshikimate-3-phosphate synthase